MKSSLILVAALLILTTLLTSSCVYRGYLTPNRDWFCKGYATATKARLQCNDVFY